MKEQPRVAPAARRSCFTRAAAAPGPAHRIFCHSSLSRVEEAKKRGRGGVEEAGAGEGRLDVAWHEKRRKRQYQ